MYPQQVPPQQVPPQQGPQQPGPPPGWPQQAQYPPAPPPKAPPVLITAQAGSHLADLLDRRDVARAELAEVKAREEALTAEIKNAVTTAMGGATTIDIDSPGRRRLRLAERQGSRVDTPRLKNERPDVYYAYLKPGKPYWELRELRGS